MAITASMVKELRGRTGAGIMDAKNALVECNGDTEAAIDWLRKKGLAAAAKKSGRQAAEGLIGLSVVGETGVLVEVNSETDFVAKNAEFQSLVRSVATASLDVDNLDGLLAAQIDENSVRDLLTESVAKIGENMSVRRMAKVTGQHVAAYLHNSPGKGLGKIGVLVAFSGDNVEAGHKVAMHVAAARPQSLSPEDLPPEIRQRELKVLTMQAEESGRPPTIIEKMVSGRMRKFFGEVTLLKQKFVFDSDVTVEKFATESGIQIAGFARFEVGEGIERQSEDFAAEVAKAAAGG